VEVDCFHMGYCVDEQLVVEPHTLLAWLDTRGSDVTDTCPLLPHLAVKLTLYV